MNKKLKMLQLCAVGFTLEKFLLPLIDEMNKLYDVKIVCSKDQYSTDLKEKGYAIDFINIDRKIGISNLISLIRLVKYMRKEKFDIVHVHTPVAGLLGRIAARIVGVKIIVYTAHGFYFHDNMSPFKKRLFVFFEKIGGLFSDFILTQSTEDYFSAIRLKIKEKNKMMAIGNGVNINKFDEKKVEGNINKIEYKKMLNIKEDRLVVGIIGRVVKEKGYIEWVEACSKIIKQYPNVVFLAVGDTLSSDRDGVKDKIDEIIKNNNLKDNIIFLGNRNDIPEVLSIMDIFTLPSYREGMPRSLIEAMCMGKPVIATDIRGCREEVKDGYNGYLVPPMCSDELADKIIDLINDEVKRKKFSKNSRERAINEFDENIVLKRQVEVFEKLTKEKIRCKV